MDEHCAELRDSGIIEPAPTSEYVSAPVMPAKKDENGEWTQRRFCIDMRQINQRTKPDHYGLHRVDELFNVIGDATCFSTCDLRAGFHQIPVDDASRDYTAFWWKNQVWRWRRMPFGLKNASAKFQQVMDAEIARAGLSHCAVAFIDDVLIFSANADEHIEHVRLVLQMLHKVGLRIHPGKSIFGSDTVAYLGHYVNAWGCKPLEAKVSGALAIPTPTNIDSLRSAIGYLSYYRCYVPNFSTIAAPLTRLFKKDVRWEWGEEHDLAFKALKTAMCTEGLALRRYDPSRPLILHTDGARLGVQVSWDKLRTMGTSIWWPAFRAHATMQNLSTAATMVRCLQQSGLSKRSGRTSMGCHSH
jgi:hypothetical protein